MLISLLAGFFVGRESQYISHIISVVKGYKLFTKLAKEMFGELNNVCGTTQHVSWKFYNTCIQITRA